MDNQTEYSLKKTDNLKAKVGHGGSKILDLISEMKGFNFDNPFDKRGLLSLINFVENMNETNIDLPNFIEEKKELLNKLNLIVDEDISTSNSTKIKKLAGGLIWELSKQLAGYTDNEASCYRNSVHAEFKF